MATLRKIPGYIPVRSNVALVGGHFRSWKATSFEKERKGKKKRDQPDGEEEEGWGKGLKLACEPLYGDWQIERADRFARNLGYRAIKKKKKKTRVENKTVPDLKPRIVSLWFIHSVYDNVVRVLVHFWHTRALHGGAREVISSFLKEEICRLRHRGGGGGDRFYLGVDA